MVVQKRFFRVQREHSLPGMHKDIKRYYQGCVGCQTSKPTNKAPIGFVQSTESVRPWEVLGVDLMGPLPRSPRGNTDVFLIVDYFSKYVAVFGLKSAKARPVAEHMFRLCCRFWFSKSGNLGQWSAVYFGGIQNQVEIS